MVLYETLAFQNDHVECMKTILCVLEKQQMPLGFDVLDQVAHHDDSTNALGIMGQMYQMRGRKAMKNDPYDDLQIDCVQYAVLVEEMLMELVKELLEVMLQGSF